MKLFLILIQGRVRERGFPVRLRRHGVGPEEPEEHKWRSGNK